jgi:acyl-CoA synthetase (AMP-forming)/AMP-acid ligase II
VTRATRELSGVATRLRAHAEDFPDKPAVVGPDRTVLTFRELDAISDGFAAGFLRAGIGKGTKTVLMLRPGPELFTVLFGLLKVGAVPVVVDPGMGVRRMLHCYRAASAEAFVGVPVAHAVRVLNRLSLPGAWTFGRRTANRSAFQGVRTTVTAGRRWFWGGHTLRSLLSRASALPAVRIEPDDLLMIGFTTGSTGPAKGVESTHGALDAMVRQVAATHDQSADDVGLVTSPMFGVLHLLVGSTCVLAPVDPTRVADADPATIADLVDKYRVTTMFASPALLDPLSRYLGRTGRRLPTLRCLVSGGAPVSERIVAALHGAGLRVQATYGATEALPISSIDAATVLNEAGQRSRAGAGTCVGEPVDGIEVRIVRITDEPMPTWSDSLLARPGSVGEITIAGPTVSRRYHGSPAANAAAANAAAANAATKIADGDRIWHRTGDLGWLDDTGRIWFCGRKSQRVGTLHTVQCEGVLNAHPDVYRTALVNADGQPVVCVEPRAGVPATEHPRIERELRSLAEGHPVTKQLRTFLFHPAFPVDIRHNAKINREYLARWASARLRPGRPRAAWAVPLAGWAFLGYGLVAGFHHPVLWALFWLDAFLSVVVHGLQIPIGLRHGRMAGHGAVRSALATLVLGATWWRGLP